MKCVNQKLSCQHSPSDYFSGNINIDKIHFEFCNLWDGYVKTAVFTKGDESYMVLLDEKNICRIPKEVLSTTGLLNIGVFGIKDEKRRTSNEVGFYVGQGVQTDGSETDITPDVYQQIVNLCEDAVEKANEAVETANSVREDVDNGVLDGGGTGGNVDLSGYVKKEEIEKLNGAYVFIGTYYELSKLPYYTTDIEEGITPVFNYQGDEIEYTQPYGGAPYLITVKDSGMTGCEDGVTRAYFTVPQNEGILFKQGMILQMNLKNQEQYLVPIHSVYDTLLDSNDVLGEIVVKIVLEQTEMFSSDISTVGCQPKATFRTGDNVAIIKVAGNVFYEIMSHDYGAEIKGLSDTIGDVSMALDELIALQEQYINGGASK